MNVATNVGRKLFSSLLTADIQMRGGKVKILQQHIWFHQRPSVFLLHLLSFRNVTPSRHASPSLLPLNPRSPPVLLCEVTCESDQLNPDHQLCLTYFRFGTLGFLAFTFVHMGLAWPHSTRMGSDLTTNPYSSTLRPHLKCLAAYFHPHWIQTGNLLVALLTSVNTDDCSPKNSQYFVNQAY